MNNYLSLLAIRYAQVFVQPYKDRHIISRSGLQNNILFFLSHKMCILRHFYGHHHDLVNRLL